jgi:hypothetical protein
MTGQSRTQLVSGDPLRGLFVGWSNGPLAPDGGGPLPRYTEGWYGPPYWGLVNADGITVGWMPRRDTGRDRGWYDPTFSGDVLMPAGVEPGRYTIKAGPAEWPVEVVPLGMRRDDEAVLNPGAALDTLQRRVKEGYQRIRLNPGLYRWKGTLNLTNAGGLTITGPGAIIRYDGPPPADTVTGFVNLIRGGQWVVFDGLTFEGPQWVRPFEADTAPNLTLVGVTFRGGCGLNAPGPGLYAERCEFDGGGLFAGLYGGLYRRCWFHDSLQDRYFTVWAADHNLAIVDCLWERADRGIVCQPNWGDIAGALILRPTMLDMTALEGGSEGVCCEGAFEETTPPDDRPKYGFRDGIILHLRYAARAGGGSALQFEGWATGNLVRDAKVSGGSGFVLWGGGVQGNDFDAAELRDGAGIFLRPGAVDNRFRRVHVVNWQPGAWNVVDPPPAMFAQTAPVWWDRPPGPGNRFVESTFTLAPQFTATKDDDAFAWDACTHNGKELEAAIL